MSRRTSIIVMLSRCLLVAVVLLAAACDHQPREPALKVYRHAMDQAAVTADPVLASTIYSSFIVTNVFDTLYMYRYLKRPYELTTNLAADLPVVSADGLLVTITLKPDARFTDHPAFPDGRGRPVTAADFVYSMHRHFDPAFRSQGAWLWQDRIVGMRAWADAGANYAEPAEGLRALDAHTIQIRLSRPFPQLMHTFASAFSAIVPREVVEHHGPEFGVKPVGSGPYTLESFDSTKAVLRANPEFRSEPVALEQLGFDSARHAELGLEMINGRSPPFVDQIELHFVADSASRWNSFTSGDGLHATIVPNEALSEVLASRQPIRAKDAYAERFHFSAGVETAILFSIFNMDDPDFGRGETPAQAARNRALRCAIIDGFDWEKHNEQFYNGLAVVYPGVIPPVVPEFDPQLSTASIEHDPAAARQTLADHGWTAENLPELVFGVPGSVTQRQIYEQFRGFMTAIGYPQDRIVLRQFASFGELNRAWKQSALPLINKGWGLDYPDAENVLQLFYGPNRTPGSNDGNYENPTFDALYEAASVLGAGPERTRMYRAMNQLLIDDCAAISGLSRTRLLAWDQQAVALPDRQLVGGHYLRYVDLRD